MNPMLLIAVLAAAAFAAGLLRAHRQRQRRRAVSALLDAADALESRLRDAREEIAAVTGDSNDPVREAMQEMLRQRLWLQQHAATASLGQLGEVQASIEAARARIDGQLLQVERARASLH